MNETDYLDNILRIDPELTKVYTEIRRYHYFNKYWHEYSRNEAFEYLEDFINDAYRSNSDVLINMVSTLDNWKEYI